MQCTAPRCAIGERRGWLAPSVTMISPDKPGWKAPLNSNGPARSLALRAALGLDTPGLRDLIDDLHGGISSASWGFAFLNDIADVEQRALVSDQLLSAVDGVQDALTDAAICVRDVNEHTGANGVAYPDATDSLEDMLRAERLRRAVADFFDATGTALDCMAAVLIVIARVPLSVQRADFTQLCGLDPTKAFASAFAEPIPQAQRDLWTALVAEVDPVVADGPDDWLMWTLEMRNALTHRGRVTDIYMPRKISGQLLVPPTAAPQKLLRYDLHLRSRPWLPAIEGMLAGPNLPASWLDEPAARTVEGLFGSLVTYVERLTAWARAKSADGVQAKLLAPVNRWVLPAPVKSREVV